MKVKFYGKRFEVPDKRLEHVVVCEPTKRGTVMKNYASTDGLHYAPAKSLCFTLWGQLPSGKNAVLITRKGRRYPAPRFVEWRREALKQCPPVAGPFVGPLHLIVDYVKGDLRRRDMPGMLDALLHLFEKAGYVLDDAQIAQQTWTPFPIDRKRPRCTVTLSPLTVNLDEEQT